MDRKCVNGWNGEVSELLTSRGGNGMSRLSVTHNTCQYTETQQSTKSSAVSAQREHRFTNTQPGVRLAENRKQTSQTQTTQTQWPHSPNNIPTVPYSSCCWEARAQQQWRNWLGTGHERRGRRREGNSNWVEGLHSPFWQRSWLQSSLSLFSARTHLTHTHSRGPLVWPNTPVYPGLGANTLMSLLRWLL